ncbi:IS66 family insertion sequence element accessory protein TnpA [Oceanisphaera arctica]
MPPQQKRQYWQAQLQAQGDSGLSKAAFCQRHGFRYRL